jgi:hypothetical protein
MGRRTIAAAALAKIAAIAGPRPLRAPFTFDAYKAGPLELSARVRTSMNLDDLEYDGRAPRRLLRQPPSCAGREEWRLGRD